MNLIERQVSAYLVHEGVNVSGMVYTLREMIETCHDADPGRDKAIGLTVWSTRTLVLDGVWDHTEVIERLMTSHHHKTRIELCDAILTRCRKIRDEGGDSNTIDHDNLIRALLGLLHKQTYSKYFSTDTRDLLRTIKEFEQVYRQERPA